ncbi:glycoside hydrolase family 15 protein [Metallibacterium sp.]|uniref:glycoside hydrolase family 15 protein n=1 Tax=Metallibacterium sp. TaxID=2940281 RepID=UPI002613EA78|nr:glycoside hydrolase family 15 protein [Metallibacterium sp.]
MNAPGCPGMAPAWSSSAKDIVGTALGSGRVWFTLGYGILDEVYWPSCSLPQIRDLGFIVAGEDFWCEVKREHRYQLSTPDAEVPLPKVVHEHERYKLEFEVLADPLRDVVLIRYRLHGNGLRLYALLAPHLGGSGHDNSALVHAHGLAALKQDNALMLVADQGFARGSAGYVGVSDGWQDFQQHNAMTWTYASASNGNVALLGELNALHGVLALSFADTLEGAQTLARASLAQGYESARAGFVEGWRHWSRGLRCELKDPVLKQAVRRSAMVLKVHDDRRYPGALIASLSIPWGNTRDDPGGYHLVWSRDAVEAGFAMLACAHHEESRALLSYLIATQQDDGHWAQNFYTDGRPYWTGVQLDEAALPVLLAAKLDELGLLDGQRAAATAMVRRALRFVARTGPLSPQDRWEENPGINPFTLAAAIAALVAGAAHGFLDAADARYALLLADDWNARIESWVYVQDTELDRAHGTHGHYVRIAPPGQDAQHSEIALKNRGRVVVAARDLLGLEYLYLVRLGLRDAADARIVDTTRLVDALLRVQTPSGAFYRRYNEDGYGEHGDGRAFDGTGVGRAWPLLTGERGQFAVQAGEDARPYLDAMLASASEGGMLPEQIWDSEPIPARGLYPGRPTGSAMPLVWAHAEFIKLATVMQRKLPIEQLAEVVARYAAPRVAAVQLWRPQAPGAQLDAARPVLIEGDAPFVLHIGHDGWQGVRDVPSAPTGLGMHGVHLDGAALATARSLEFTRRFLDGRDWEGRDWRLQMGAPA